MTTLEPSEETETFIPDEADASGRWEEFESALDELPEDGGADDGFLSADIPVKRASVNLEKLHPELYARLAKAFEDPRISEIARVSSGVRTYEQQVYLYKKYGRGRAANPDYKRKDGRRGSNHMVQRDTYRYAGKFEPGPYGYAVDVGFWKGAQWDLLRTVMAENGLRLTVFRPFEPWHFELDPKFTGQVSRFRFKAKGSGVVDMQQLLLERHEQMPNTIPDLGKADGIVGAKTEAATRAWQELIGVEADGTWDPDTENATAEWLQKRTKSYRKGSKGDVVRELQTYLGERHRQFPGEISNPGKPDGDFGTNTHDAVKSWQDKLGITADGIWGEGTWKASDRFDDQQRAAR